MLKTFCGANLQYLKTCIFVGDKLLDGAIKCMIIKFVYLNAGDIVDILVSITRVGVDDVSVPNL